jgi:peptide/nickel transport system substrate-binding protein
VPRTILALFLILLTFLLPGCATETSADPGMVTIALDQPPENLDPRVAQIASSQRMDFLLFNSLVKKNEQLEIVPDLAVSWDMPDPRTYIFHLRNDVKFHDGRPLTSKDVVFTFRSILDGSIFTAKGGHPYNLIDTIEAPDDYTVVFKLKEVFTPFLWNLARGGIGIVPEGSGEEFRQHPIGSGPFVFDHYFQDQEVVMKRNDDYFEEKAGVSGLRFKIVPEAVVQALELRKGSADITLNVLTPDMIETLKRDKTVNVLQSEGTNYQYIAFNLADPVFSDLRVRQAIAYGIDREKIIKYLWRSQARAATGLLPPNNWAYEPNVTTYPYDPERARQLLKESGHEHLSFTYRTSQDDTGRLVAAVLQQQMREIGVTMEIRSNEFATFFSDIVNGQFQMYSLRWIGANNDPDMLNAVFHSKMVPPNGFNRGHYSNPRVDDLIESSRRETDQEKRKAAYQEIQRIVAEELPYLSMFYVDNVCVYNKRVEDVHLSPTGDYDFLMKIHVR